MYSQILVVMLLIMMGGVQAISLKQAKAEGTNEKAILIIGCIVLVWNFLMVFALHWGGFW